MTPGDSEQEFRKFACQRGHHLDSMRVGDGLRLILEFFEGITCSEVALEDGDMLLFQWGTYDWGDGRNFEIGITRQFIEARREDDDSISQLHLTFKFSPDSDVDALKGDLWCPSRDALADFRAAVLNHPALAVASTKPVVSKSLSYEYV